MTSWTPEHIEIGLRLRRHGLSYTAITFVLGEYHGLWYSEASVRRQLRQAGAVAQPRGGGRNLLVGRRQREAV